MIIFPEIDKKQTKMAAQKKLKSYPALLRLIPTAALPEKQAQYFLVFHGQEIQQVSENKFLERKKMAQEEMKKIIDAFNKLDEFERRLIYDKYMSYHENTNIALYLSYHISESKFYRELEKALIHFAESYDQGQLLFEETAGN